MAVERHGREQPVGTNHYRTEKRPAPLIRKTRLKAVGLTMVLVGMAEVVVPGIATPLLLGGGVGLILWQSGGKVAFRVPKWDKEAKKAPPVG